MVQDWLIFTIQATGWVNCPPLSWSSSSTLNSIAVILWLLLLSSPGPVIRRAALDLQTGQMGVFRSQISIHSAWKLWLHTGNNLHLSPAMKFSKQTAQSTGLLPFFSLHLKSKLGNFSISSRDMLLLLSPVLLLLPFVNPLLKALPTIQVWIITRKPMPTNNNATDITIVICRSRLELTLDSFHPQFSFIYI